MTIKIGDVLLFDYPPAYTTTPDYTAHNQQMVTVLRPLDREEYENMGDDMWRVRAADGWEGDVWDSELLAPGEARKWQ
jgi:hypothetical protein